MNKKSLSLEEEFKVQFEVQKLDFELQKNPEKAKELALNYYENFLTVLYHNKVLEAENKALKQKQSSPPSLPPFKVRRDK